MDNFLGRLILVAICVPLGMHGIGYGMEINGGARRSNPVWMLLQGYFDFEEGVFKLLLILAVIAFLIWFFIFNADARAEAKDRKQEMLKIEKEKAQEEEKRRLERLEWEEHDREMKEKHEREKEVKKLLEDAPETLTNVQSGETECKKQSHLMS